MDISTMKARQSEKGFTLVELAVVMIIIGLLIGGVLKGQELITNARITTTASEMESFGAAYNGFVDKYNVQPGDMSNPATRIPGCAAACAQAGDADGIVDANMGAAAAAGEGTGFFGQLLNAGFISGMTGDATTGAGIANPSAPVPGGNYKVGDVRTGAAPTAYVAAQLVNRPYIILDAGVGAASATSGALTPGQGSNIDARLDDGNPQTGVVVGVRGTATTGCSNAAATAYNEIAQQAACSIAYRF